MSSAGADFQYRLLVPHLGEVLRLTGEGASGAECNPELVMRVVLERGWKFLMFVPLLVIDACAAAMSVEVCYM